MKLLAEATGDELQAMVDKAKGERLLGAARGSGAGETLYPCADCGTLRTKAEGGTTFTVCDECWEKHYAKYREGKRPNVKLSDASDAFAPAQCSAVRPEIVKKPNETGSK